jgi:outer membrane lipopolysaccharide assembly protein LptE/RlpB
MRRPARDRLRAGVALLLLSTLTACGYNLAGRGGGDNIPDYVRAVVITAFENRTQKPEVEQRITEEVSSEFVKRGRYKLVPVREDAQALLEGAVLDYREQPVQFTSEGRTTRVEAVVSIAATLRDLTNDEVLWRQTDLLFREQYDVPESGEFFDQGTLALDLIAVDAAEALVASIFEGF